MRLTLALCFLLNVEPAFAHCYSVWRYPWPQNCRARPAQPPRKTWFVEIAPERAPPTPASVNVEDPVRAAAVEQLKEELRQRAATIMELQAIGLTTAEEKQ